MLQQRMGLQAEASEDDILRVKYLYTAMQQEQSVPLELYSIDMGPTLDSRARVSLQLVQPNRKSLAMAQPRRENSHLKAKIPMLEKENEQLRANNTSRFCRARLIGYGYFATLFLPSFSAAVVRRFSFKCTSSSSAFCHLVHV